MQLWTKSFLAVKEQAQKGRFEEEREHSFHRQRLADHATRRPRECGPIGPELKFHWNPSHHAHSKVDCKDSRPEPSGVAVQFVLLDEGK